MGGAYGEYERRLYLGGRNVLALSHIQQQLVLRGGEGRGEAYTQRENGCYMYMYLLNV